MIVYCNNSAKTIESPSNTPLLASVVEAPSLEHLSTLVLEPRLAAHQSGGCGQPAELVAHFTPPHMVRHPSYQQWLSAFPSTTSHIFLNEDSSCTGSEAVHRIQHKLRFLDPKVFPELYDRSIPDLAAVDAGVAGDSFTKAVTSLTYHLRPSNKFDR